MRIQFIRYVIQEGFIFHLCVSIDCMQKLKNGARASIANFHTLAHIQVYSQIIAILYSIDNETFNAENSKSYRLTSPLE